MTAHMRVPRRTNINEVGAVNQLAELHRTSAADLTTVLAHKKDIIELVFNDCKEMETSVKRLEGAVVCSVVLDTVTWCM